MIEEGILEVAGTPDQAFALHVYPNKPCGTIYSRPGPIMAAADTITIRVIGKGGHGSMPWDALDPVSVACEMVQAFKNFVTRCFNPFFPVVVTVGRISSGTTNNVIPEFAEMELTVRSFSEENREKIHSGIRSLSEGIAGADGLSAKVEIGLGYPPTVNDSTFHEYAKAICKNILGPANYIEMEAPLPGAEDFSLVLERIPGCFLFLGAAPTQGGQPCHSNRMILNEEAMQSGVSVLAALVLGRS